MPELFVPLMITPGITGIYLNDPCGTDEIAVEETNTRTALALIKGLLRSERNQLTNSNINVAQIVTADRDRILAQIYTAIYGPKIRSELDCENCEKRFDLDFSLADLLNHYPLTNPVLLPDGSFEIEPGTSFRFPTGEDELLVDEFSVEDGEDFLMSRCLVKGDLERDSQRVQQKMSEMAPVLNIEMQAACPECGHTQEVQFDIQSFLLTKLKHDRPGLIREIHSIAINYHWAPDSILALPRNLRKQYVALIESPN